MPGEAEALVEDPKQSMLKSLEELYHLSKTQARIEGLRSTIERLSASELHREELPAPTLDQDQIEERSACAGALRDLAAPTLDPDQVEDEEDEDEEEKEPKAGRRHDHLRY